MDQSITLDFVMKDREKKHKGRPTRFNSVASGRQNRRESNLQYRKSSRLTVFDTERNLSVHNSPIQAKKNEQKTDAQKKTEHRLQQLQKFKEEKAKQKKEAAKHKMKPFVAGAVHNSLAFVPPPPIQNKPNSQGMVTRAQSRNKQQITVAPSSFAPSNAQFRPSIKINAPNFVPNIRNSKVKPTITFNPVIHNTSKSTKPISNIKQINENKPSTSRNVRSTRQLASESIKKAIEIRRNVKKSPKKPKLDRLVESSESSSDMQSPEIYEEPKQTVHAMRGKFKKTEPTKSKATTEPVTSNDYSADPKLRNSPITLIENSPSICGWTKNTEEKDSNKSKPGQNKKPVQTKKAQPPKISKQVKKSVQSKSCSDLQSKNSLVITDIEKHTKESPQELLSTPDRAMNKRVPKSESNSEEKLKSPKNILELTPEQFEEKFSTLSPCVTMSRGKENALRETKRKLKQGLLKGDQCSDDADPLYFRQLLDSETVRITRICNHWDEIYENTSLPEFVQELVLGAVGQARLFMSQKMQQFAGLVQRCEAGDSSHGLVTAVDLRGFWDMIYIQIENIGKRFKNLDELEARDWAEELPAKEAKKPAKNGRKKTARPTGTSRIKDMIAAARKAKHSSLDAPAPEEKSFDGGFFAVRSPVKVATPTTPAAKPSLLKCVLSNEANKASAKKSFAMLNASLKGKNIGLEGVSVLELTPIDYNATPARSILKSSQKTVTASGRKTVVFNRPSYTGDGSPEFAQKGRRLSEPAEKPISPVRTRRMRKSLAIENQELTENTPKSQPKQGRQKKPLQDIFNVDIVADVARISLNDETTPRRSTRASAVRASDLIDLSSPASVKKPTRRTRNKV